MTLKTFGNWIEEKKSRLDPYRTSFQKFWWEVKSHYHGPQVEPQIQEKGIKIRWTFRESPSFGGGITKSVCDVEFLPKWGDHFAVIFTELSINEGKPVMNIIEDLATVLYQERLRYVPLETIEWYIH